MVGYSFRVPGSGVVNASGGARTPGAPTSANSSLRNRCNPCRRTFERAASAGVAVSVISGAEFTGSGLTRAVLRGGRYVGVHALGDLAASVHARSRVAASATPTTASSTCSAMFTARHRRRGACSCGRSTGWWNRSSTSCHTGGLLAVVADHGMVAVAAPDIVDIDDCEQLLDGVQAVGGEARARHVYVTDGAQDSVLAAWRETLAERAWVVSREEAITAGWFGESIGDDVLPRIGDIIAAARGTAAMVRRKVEPLESSLIGTTGR